MTTNPLLTRRAAPAREAVPIETMVARWNAELKRDDVEWIIGHDGKPHLVHRATDFDRGMDQIKQGGISQSEIDRMPFRIRRIAWNRGFLNCDYGEPPRYWVPGRKANQEEKPARQHLSWYDE